MGPGPSSYLATLASFVPAMVLDAANRGRGQVSEPSVERFEAAVLFVDVAGFTALTESLAARGAAGAEDLTALLNTYFGQIIDTVLDRGGDIVKFAGDAIIALWPAGPRTLPEQVLTVLDAALDMQGRLNDYEVAPGFRLRMKLSVGAGEVLAERLGGVYDRWELLVAGDALRQIGAANDHAKPGDVILAAEARSLIADRIEGETLPDGARRVSRLVGLRPGRAAATAPVPLPEAAPALKAFIPAAVRSRLDADQLAWLGELRRLSVMFVNLPDFGVKTPLERAQEAMRAMQMALYRFEGSINKMSVDDKGASLIAVFGLPPLAHGDDPERAVRAAVALKAALDGLDFGAWIGVTSGTAFCGAVGNERRREYTIMGDVVNLAARLMQAAAGGKAGAPVEGGILCDAQTWTAAAARLAFAELPPVMVKGKAEPVAIYRPTPQARPAPLATAGRRRVRIVGREAERELIARLLDRVTQGGRPARMLLTGDAGLGKSRLLQEAIGLAADRGMLCLAGGGDAIETATPYRAWRQVFERLFATELLGAGDDAHRRAAVLDALPADPVVLRDVPLIEAVLPFGWPDNDFTRGLEGRARAERTRGFLAQLLRAVARETRLLLVIEDAGWLDSASLALLQDLMRSPAPLALIASARPFEAEAPVEWLAIAALDGVETLALGPLEAEALIELCRRRLGVDRLPDAVARFLIEKSEGNPLFAEELAFSLRETGTLVIADGACNIAAGHDDPTQWHLPSNIEGLIAARIDRLAPAEQMTMKVASVIGRVFMRDALAHIHPSSEAERELLQHCEELARLELTPPVKDQSLLAVPGGGAAWKFKSSLIKDVAYNRMLFAQRRDLHRKLADWLEARPEAERAELAPLIAFHWHRAADDRVVEPEAAQKAIGHYARAAAHAARLHALREAIGFWREALGLIARLPESAEQGRQELRLLLELGPAQVAAGSFSAPEVEATFDRARALGAKVGRHAQLFRALRGQWQVSIGHADYAKAAALAEELLLLAMREKESGLALEAHRAIGTTAFWLAEAGRAREHFERAVGIYDPAQHRGLLSLYGLDPAVASRGLMAWALAYLGDAAAAQDSVERAVAWAQELKHPFTLSYAHGSAMWTGYFLDAPAAAAAPAKACADLSLERGIPYLAAAAKVVHGWAAGDLDEVRAAVRGWRQLGGGIGLPIFLIVQADAERAAGLAVEAAQTLNDPLLLARLGAETWAAIIYHRVRGETLAALGDGAAHEAFAAGLALARKTGCNLHVGRLERLLASTGGRHA